MPAQPRHSNRGLDERLEELERLIRSLKQTVDQQPEATAQAVLGAIGASGSGSGSAGGGSGSSGSGGGTGSGGSGGSGGGPGGSSGSGGGGSGGSGGSGGGSGNGLTYPTDLPGLANAVASDYTGSAANRIQFLTAAVNVLSQAEAKHGGGVPPDLIPPITKVVLDVLDFIDRNLSAADLDTMTGLKQQLASLLQQSVPAIQAVPVPLIRAVRPTGR
jgi:hypothetical protein